MFYFCRCKSTVWPITAGVKRGKISQAAGTRCFAAAENPAVLSYDKIRTVRVACVFARGHRSSQEKSMFYFCVWKARFDQFRAGVKIEVEPPSVVEQNKSRWRTYRFECSLRNFETVSSPPREESYVPSRSIGRLFLKWW